MKNKNIYLETKRSPEPIAIGEPKHFGFATAVTKRKWWQFWKPREVEEIVEITQQKVIYPQWPEIKKSENES